VKVAVVWNASLCTDVSEDTLSIFIAGRIADAASCSDIPLLISVLQIVTNHPIYLPTKKPSPEAHLNKIKPNIMTLFNSRRRLY
jgi:hypothetical protein